MGFFKYGFVLSFYFLLRVDKQKGLEGFYEKALSETIALGGDTDTNACIVCAMVGALVGLSNIPQPMITKVLDFDCTEAQGDVKRDQFLSVKQHAVDKIKGVIDFRAAHGPLTIIESADPSGK